MIKIKIEKPFKLEDTITCGQIFRFFKMEDGSFDIILKDDESYSLIVNDIEYIKR